MTLSPTKDAVRFGPFELDQSAWQLHKNGIRIRIPQQPLQLLAVLVERPGVVLTREELQQRLWPSEVFVDFDHGLNKNIQKLREALGDSADSPKYIETIPRVGYRFIGTLADPPESLAPPPAIPPQPAIQRLWWRRRLPWAVLAGCAAGLMLAVWLVQKRAHASPIHSLAVLPLENLSGDPTKEYFAEGITDELITELARIPNLRVVSRTSVMQDQGARKPLKQIARELDVDAVVEGSVVLLGDRVRITAQLIDARADKHLWAQSFEDSATDILSLQDNVAREIASQTKVALLPPQTSEAKQLDPRAQDAYLRGLYFLNRREALKSGNYFQQAILIEPSYAAAYAGLAGALEAQDLRGVLKAEEAWPRALAAAKRAVELDPSSGEAYTALGSLEMRSEYDWPAAQRDLLRGIALSPSFSLAEMHYAVYLDATNRPEEAVTHMRRALQLDPLSFFMTRHLGSVLFYARHYDEALFYLGRASEMVPESEDRDLVQNWVARIYEAKGQQAEVVRVDTRDTSDTDLNALRVVYQRSGWKAYQAARIRLYSRYAAVVCFPFEVSLSNLRLGNQDQAFVWLNRAVDQHCFWTLGLQVDPMFDGLRADPQYKSALARLNLHP